MKENYKTGLAIKRAKRKNKNYSVSPEAGKRITRTAVGLEGLMQKKPSERVFEPLEMWKYPKV